MYRVRFRKSLIDLFTSFIQISEVTFSIDTEKERIIMYLIRNIQCRDPYPQAKLEIFLKEGCVRKMCY